MQGVSTGRSTPASLPVLLRSAAATYAVAIEVALGANGHGDLPRTGYRVIGLLAPGPQSIQELADRLRMSKQGVGRLSDALVERGFVTRQHDPADRRRVLLELTVRGHAAAEEGRAVIDRINRELARCTSAASIEITRRTLLGLIEIGHDALPTEPH